MPIIVQCPLCATRMTAPDTFAGCQARCASCKGLLDVPGPPPGTQAPPVARVEPDEPRSERPSGRRRRESRSEEEDRRPERRRSRFRCPFCGTEELPRVDARISAAGWSVFVVLLVFCFPLFWIGLLIKEEVRSCYDCGAALR
jgi:hypothetical protein